MNGKSHIFCRQRGASLIEVMIAMGILLAVMAAFTTFLSNQLKAFNFLEAQGKKSQLNLVLMGQFLNDPNNCKCLFAGSPNFLGSGGVTLISGANAIGKFDFKPPSSPGDCATATLPEPWVTRPTGTDGLILKYVALENIVPIAGKFDADFAVGVESTKETLGPKSLSKIKIPVTLTATDLGGGMHRMDGCAIQAASAAPADLSCPADMEVIPASPAGGGRSFCIEKVENGIAKTWEGANLACVFLRRRMCTGAEWMTACESGAVPGMAGHWEWINEIAGIGKEKVFVVGNPACNSQSMSNNSTGRQFRCCVN